MADLRDRLFTFRSYTPVPFLIIGLVIGHPTIASLILGLAVALLGESFRFWGVGHASYETRVTESVGAPRLVTSGPFGYVRNPLYIGNMLLYTGFGVMSATAWLIILTLAWFIFQYHMIVSREEEFLANKFGEEYRLYREAVPRFIPRLTPYGREHDMKIDWRIAMRSERRTFQAIVIATALMIGKFLFEHRAS